jgi:N-acetylmuramoyl-L-alanine amidase
LNGYRAWRSFPFTTILDCVNDEAIFKVAAALNTHDLNRANRLTACLVDRYQRVTDLTFREASPAICEYAFREIDPNTVAAIIETGFLNLDREILTKQTERVADGVVEGILCFANNENIEPTPISNSTP